VHFQTCGASSNILHHGYSAMIPVPSRFSGIYWPRTSSLQYVW
jgi:hypothetical protein